MQTCPSCAKGLPPGLESRFCPFCGFPIEGTAARPGWIRGNIDLRTVARRQRNILWLILAQIAAYVMMLGISSTRMGAVSILPGVFYFLTMIAMVVVIIQLMAALRISIIVRILAVVLCLAPCISLLMLLYVNSQATSALRNAGLKVGLLGVPDEQVTRLLSAYACRSCGYSLIGNVSGVCPECGTACV